MSTKWTVDRIIKEAAKRSGWEIRGHMQKVAMIRRVHHVECPISCLLGRTSADAWDVARELRIPKRVARAVISAADFNRLTPTRRKMLRAFHLQEEEG